MAIEAKATLLSEIERDLSTELTAADCAKVLRALADRLSEYRMDRLENIGEASDDLLDAYLNALSVSGRSEKTIKRYEYILGKMRDAVRTPTRQITVYHLRHYLAGEKERGISDRTLEGIRQCFNAYFGWLWRERLIEFNPTANLGAIKYQKKEKDLYSDVDVERMKLGCKSQRDKALVCFLRATGCRISEVTQLDRGDVDFVSLECKVLGKGNKERIVFLDQVAAMNLKLYLDARKDDDPALFVGKRHNRITPHGVRQMLVKLGERTDVQHVHPHKFRRTTATNLIRRGMPIQEVAKILGHDKLDTTMQYVVLDKTEVKHSYMKYAS